MYFYIFIYIYLYLKNNVKINIAKYYITMDSSSIWKIIDTFFKENPNSLVHHHLESYNDFFKHGIFQIFKEKGPIFIGSNYDEKKDEFSNQCYLYCGGKNGDKIYFGKPVIYDEHDNIHYMYPNEARLRNMTYGMTIHYDIEVEFVNILKENEMPRVIGGDIDDSKNWNEETDGGYIIDEKFTNFKELNKNERGGEGGEGEEGEEGEGLPMVGGGPKKTKNVKDLSREKRVIKPYEVTTAMMAAMREATERSMNTQNNTQTFIITIEKVFLGKFPIMLQSDYCILSKLPPEIRYSMGECRRDLGGYFIIQGKEKTVVMQEKFGDNMLYIRKFEGDDVEYLYSAEIRSVSENVSKPIRTLSVKIVAPSSTYTFKNIVVNIPNVRKPVPLFIVFRALGIISDKDIITTCLLDLNKYEQMIDLFVPSVHDAGAILTQQLALKYIGLLTKGKRIDHALEILSDYFLPHIGEVNFTEKAYYLGNMIFRLLSVYHGLDQPTDRDNYKYKRVELVGSLLYDLFREHYNMQHKSIQQLLESRLYFNKSIYENDLPALLKTFNDEEFRKRKILTTIEDGFRKAFKGNWGATAHTKRIGVVQDLNRLSFNSSLNHLRKTNLPLDASAKVVGPRVLHSSQWGFIDPIDTPDGGNIGLHKSLAISTYVTLGNNAKREHMVNWLREKISMKFVEECSPMMLSVMTKVMLNGYWAGSIFDPFDCVTKMKLFRRNALLPIYTSITFDIKLNAIFIYTDGGRLCRPIFYRDEETDKLSFDTPEIMKQIKDGNYSWNDLITGFNEKRIENFNPNENKIYELQELYKNVSSEKNLKKAVIDYIDSSESENALISINQEEYSKKKYTHLEIHESLIFGTLCNLINFPENNPPTRNSFSCGQSKQACSLYHTNYQMRMDKTAVVLNNGQVPLVKSRFLDYINKEENPYGENVIVAIMCYTGYNVEDAVLLNEGSLKRGMFNTTYYSTYEAHEESSKNIDTVSDLRFLNIEMDSTVIGTKSGYDYSKLDKFGIIKEGTEINDKTVLIGLASSSSDNKNKKIDNSKTTKKGQLGIVDKTFITEGEEGQRIAKVRIREQRIPTLGDKFASRAGQKGTVGLVVPEMDMPFTKDGIRPDIIINPHALPSRMTIGQLVECLLGKTCAMFGGFGDCTAFINKGSKIKVFGELLLHQGYHSSGNEILYNGMSGEQLESEIFIGPTYYMRLKHMVKDKINYRALGPRTALTKQPVSGRANDGGLRIGEMERDSVISHGITNFLTESMMERGDKYYIAVCNVTGVLAIYNPSKNIFLSPMADGPVKFISSLDGKDMNIENITKFGRNFSVVCIPYSLKLLIQELQTINIQLRIITEDNIQQLESLSFSKNIENIIDNSDPMKLKDKILKSIQSIKKSKEFEVEEKYENTQKYEEPLSPQYPDFSPAYKSTSPLSSPPEGSPQYPDFSPAYQSPNEEISEEISEETNTNNETMVGGNGNYQFDNNMNMNMNMNTDIPYDIGDQVLFRGGKSEKNMSNSHDYQSIWKIVKMGDKILTIQRELPPEFQHNFDKKNDIKVVTKSDIYKPIDISQTLSSMKDKFQQREPFLENYMLENGYTNTNANANTNDNTPPNINFAPVINVIGRDNHGDIPQSKNNTDETSLPNNQQNEFEPLVFKNNIQPHSEDKSNNMNNTNNKKIQGDGELPIDFSKLIVKKV